MIPYIYKDPIYSVYFKHMIVGYEDFLFCSKCNQIIPDYVSEKNKKNARTAEQK